MNMFNYIEASLSSYSEDEDIIRMLNDKGIIIDPDDVSAIKIKFYPNGTYTVVIYFSYGQEEVTLE